MSAPSATAKRLTVAARRATLPLLHILRPRRYTDADPYRIIDIPTARITRMQCRWDGALKLPWLDRGRFGRHSSLLRRWHAGIVLDGDWDLATEAFADYHLTQVLQARFGEGCAWDDIPYIRKALRKVCNGETAWGGRCHDEAELRARCRYLDMLHARMATEGYRPDAATDSPVAFTHFLVNIGRDGTIIRNNDGKHRIILARILGIPSLPARVLVRHRAWQQVRDAVRSGVDERLLMTYGDHPDLEDLRDRWGDRFDPKAAPRP